MKYNFRPIEGLWIFHLIYLIGMVILAWSFFPFVIFQSFLVMSIFALIGLISFLKKWQLLSHLLAFVVGISSPIIFFMQIEGWQTAVFMLLVLLITFLGYKYLF